MSDAEELKIFGAMASHIDGLAARAGASQTQAEAMLGQAATLYQGLDEQAQALKAQEQRLSAQIDALADQIARLGPQAFAGGKSAVAPEVRAALQGAAMVIGDAALAVTAPTQKTMKSSLAALDRAQAALTEAQARFSWRALAILGAAALGCLVLAGLGGFVLIGWQKSEIANARQELSGIQDKAQSLRTEVADLEKKSRELDARGVRFKTEMCQDGVRKRLCVEIEPSAGTFGPSDGGGKREFRVPKGY